jgi:Glycosyl hydrolase family 67 N-terminus
MGIGGINKDSDKRPIGNVGECGLLIWPRRFTRLFLLLGLLFTPSLLLAETGYNSWLRYSALDEDVSVRYRQVLPAAIATLSGAPPVQSGQQELIVGIRRMLGRTLRATSGMPVESAILLGTLADLRKAGPALVPGATLPADGYWLKTLNTSGRRYIVITAENDRGVLYGAFALLRKIALGNPIDDLDEKQSPSVSMERSSEVMEGGRSFGRVAVRGKTSIGCAITAVCWPHWASTVAPLITSMPTRTFWDPT